MVEVLSFDEQALHVVRYLNATRRGGTEVCRLTIERARVRALPDTLDAIVATSDLQGVVRGYGDEATLLGVAVAEALEELAFDGVLPSVSRTGVLLAGDMYSVPEANKRGGFGDVAPVWQAFAARFAWTAGVAGNHDDVTRITGIDGAYLLDGDVIELDGFRIGGVGLVCGNPQKRGRRDEDEQLAWVEEVAKDGCDILVLHEGPNGSDEQLGNPRLREVLESRSVPLTVCGHVHWPRPLARCAAGQILNVDTRVVVLTR